MLELWDDAARTLDEAVAGGVFPGACALVARGDAVVFEHATGTLAIPSSDRAATRETIWDLASLTKPLVTVALVLVMIERGLLRFDDRIAALLPAFGAGDDPRRQAVTLRHLLHHDSGLPAHRRFFEMFAASFADPAAAAAVPEQRRRIFAAALAEPLERDPGAASVYSDLGFMVLGAVLESVGGERIDRLARRFLLDPLEIEDAWFVDAAEAESSGQSAKAAGTARVPLERVAATGFCPWRGRIIHGVVQDENAYAMGGIAPHAGLFATTSAVHALALEWSRAARDQGQVLRGPLVRQVWERGAEDVRSTWALGWDTPSVGASSAGALVSEQAVGHLGYTGTSLWIDRRRSVHVVLLTNRIASDTKGDGIRALRPRFHDAVFRALDEDRS
ncbi:MAG: beta-lactamase family protein [Deltaproteobacteria bacterium]|nr:beta-lactamase family protein [Deltaproteobacteria bacterium]